MLGSEYYKSGSGPGLSDFFLWIRNTDINFRVRWRWVRAAAIFVQISHPRSYPHSGRLLSWVYVLPVLQIHDILVWIRIRIRGAMLLTNGSGSGSCYFYQWPSRRQQKSNLKKMPFYLKKMSLKSLYLIIICNLTHLQDENTKVKCMLRKLDKNHVGS